MADVYTIQPGDTLGKIAVRFGVSLADLLELNPGFVNPDLIHVGDQLNVPEGNGTDAGAANAVLRPAPAHYANAIGELLAGVNEIVGHEHNPRIVEYHATTTLAATNDEVPWCSSFVCWCVEQAGIASTRSARARSWLDWGLHGDAARGAIVVLSRGANPQSGHVGFFVEHDREQRFFLLGGNQSNAVTIESFPWTRVLDVRWPRFA